MYAYTAITAKYIGIVWFIVAVEVCRHNGIRLIGISRRHGSGMYIAYQHHGIVIRGMARVKTQRPLGIGNGGIDLLVLTIDIVGATICIAIAATDSCGILFCSHT